MDAALYRQVRQQRLRFARGEDDYSSRVVDLWRSKQTQAQLPHLALSLTFLSRCEPTVLLRSTQDTAKGVRA